METKTETETGREMGTGMCTGWEQRVSYAHLLGRANAVGDGAGLWGTIRGVDGWGGYHADPGDWVGGKGQEGFGDQLRGIDEAVFEFRMSGGGPCCF